MAMPNRMPNGVRRTLLIAAVLAAGLLPVTAEAKDKKPEAMVVEFSIKDYAAWRPVFDGAAADRMAAGVSNARVFRDADKPDRMLVIFDVASKAKGTAWMKSTTVRADWQKGGVVGEPAYRFLK